MTTHSWTTAFSADWSADANWSPTGAPNAFTDDAVIAASGTYTVSIAAGEAVQANTVSVTSSGATLSVLGSLTLGSTLSVQSGLVAVGGVLSGGTATVSGGTLEVTPGGVISSAISLSSGTVWVNAPAALGAVTITGGTLLLAGSVTMDSATLGGTVNNYLFFGNGNLTTTGTTTIGNSAGPFTVNVLWNNIGDIEDNSYVVYTSSSLNNMAGATFDMAAGSFIVSIPDFENYGLLKMSNPGLVRFSSYLDNYGSVEIDSGTLDMLGGAGYFQGTFTVAPSASFDFVSGNYYLDSPDSYKNGATAVVNGAVTLDGGMFALRAQPNTLTITGNMLWNSGGFALNDAGGVLNTNGTVTINSPSAAIGSDIWNDAGGIVLSAASALSLSGPTLSTQGTVLNLIGNAGVTVAAGASFTNAGNIWRTYLGGSGAGLSTITGNFSNTGKITVNIGTLRLTGSVSGAGWMLIGGSATLELAGGAQAGSNSIQFLGAAQGTTLKLDSNTAIQSTVSGLAPGVRIDLAAASAATAVVNGSTLSITPQGGSALDFVSSTPLTGLIPEAASDGSGGSMVTLYGQALPSSFGGVAFGNHHTGDVVSTTLPLTNTAFPVYSENLNAAVSTAVPGIIATGSITGLAPGATNSTALVVGLNTATTGAISGSATITLTSDGTGIDSEGLTPLTAQTINVSGAVYAFATASLGGVTSLDFGDLHTGQTVSQSVTLTNAALAGFAEKLDAAWSVSSGGISGLGSASGILPGGSAVLQVQAATSLAGAVSGTVVLAPVSDGFAVDWLGNTALPGQTLSATGTVYNYATAALASSIVDFGVVHIGGKAAQLLSLSNAAAIGGYSEALDATLSGGGGAIAVSGSVSLLAAGSSDGADFSAMLNTAAAGVFTATATLAVTSDGTGIDTLGTTALAGQTITLTGTVNNYATAEWQSSAGTLSGTGANVTLDLGLVYAGGPVAQVSLGVLNSGAGVADLLSSQFSLTGGGGAFTNAGFADFSGVAAGQQDSAPSIALSASTAGVYSETIVLTATGSNASGYSGALAAQTLTVTGTVAAPGTFTLTSLTDNITATLPNNLFFTTATALNTGDRIVGGSGFNSLTLQGPGRFRLGSPAKLSRIQSVQAQEGQVGGSGQQTVRLRAGLDVTVQVASATPDPANPAVPGITIIGANDHSVINLGTGHDIVYAGSAFETINGGGAAAQIYVTAATAGVAIAANGAALSVSGGGTVSMGANQTGLASVHLLGGTAGAPGTVFTANATPGLRVLGSNGNDSIAPGDASQAIDTFGQSVTIPMTPETAGALVTVHSGSATLEISGSAGQTATLNDLDSHGIVARLDSANLSLNLGGASLITGIAAATGDSLTAGHANQTLISLAGGATLTGMDGQTTHFQGTALGLDGGSIGHFGTAADLDITDLNPASLVWSFLGTGSDGVLSVSDGSHAASITFLGDLTGHAFHAKADGAGGTLFKWH